MYAEEELTLEIRPAVRTRKAEGDICRLSDRLVEDMEPIELGIEENAAEEEFDWKDDGSVYPEEISALPIHAAKERIFQTLVDSRLAVVIGDTGCGKSTQIPQILMDVGSTWADTAFGAGAGAVLVLASQPRRVGAITLARRVASERGCALGGEVGYSVQFAQQEGPETRLRYCSDDCLIREWKAIVDDTSRRYIVVLDEAHERSLYTDILVGLVKQALFGDLPLEHVKVVVASATLDVEEFAKFYNNSPVVRVVGRCFPVDTVYAPPTQMLVGGGASRLMSLKQRVDAVVNASVRLHVTNVWEPPSNHDAAGAERPPHPGHILAFVTGQDDCEACCKLAYELLSRLDYAPTCLVIPLYQELTPAQQAQAFHDAPFGVRKIIFASNIAETSITIPGVTMVVDAGLTRVRSVNAKTGLEAHPVVQISKSEAIQRAGRAGRTEPGRCFRLYSEEHYERLAESPKPEICRSELSSVVLSLKSYGVGNVVRFPFLSSPDKSQLVAALKKLYLLGAVTADSDLTSLGRMMAQFPLRPEYARSIILSERYLPDLTDDVISVVSVLSSDKLWLKPHDTSGPPSQLNRFRHYSGDHLLLLNIFSDFQAVAESDAGAWCDKHRIRLRALKQAGSARKQLRKAVRDLQEQIGDAQVSEEELDLLRQARGWRSTSQKLLMLISLGLQSHVARPSKGGTWMAVFEAVTVVPASDSSLWLRDRRGRVYVQESDWLLFDEIAGEKEADRFGLLQTVSVIDKRWSCVRHRLEGLDIRRLLALDEIEAKPVFGRVDLPQLEQNEDEFLKLAAEAKARYVERKRQKVESR
ncbi:MAG: hypothetical protein KVP17_000371 [Porospora cf. gigantea B]|uniref:uncharacterized protein n=1 Tax=Porospora cf. gigantea B TaxID=2853592 RepID=UPI003571ECB4|nr:MAG: hypothetical protein KVP17_000371 [Porospora cf. gigantea B]